MKSVVELTAYTIFSVLVLINVSWLFTILTFQEAGCVVYWNSFFLCDKCSSDNNSNVIKMHQNQ